MLALKNSQLQCPSPSASDDNTFGKQGSHLTWKKQVGGWGTWQYICLPPIFLCFLLLLISCTCSFSCSKQINPSLPNQRQSWGIYIVLKYISEERKKTIQKFVCFERIYFSDELLPVFRAERTLCWKGHLKIQRKTYYNIPNRKKKRIDILEYLYFL